MARALRDRVWARADLLFPPRGAVLDAGCGIGLDAAWLCGTGRAVTAIDASAGMVAEARRRASKAQTVQVSLEEAAQVLSGPFQGALLDFGVINCVDLAGTARSLAALLAPDAPLLVVPMPRVPPTWLLAQLRAGRPRAALRRLAPEVQVDVEGIPVRTRYLGARTLGAALAPWFRLERWEGLGFLLPPPGSRISPDRLRRLAEIEARCATWPGLRDVGDHLLVELRRTSVPVAD